MRLNNPREGVPKELWPCSGPQPVGEVPGRAEGKPESWLEELEASEGSTPKALSHRPLLSPLEARAQSLDAAALSQALKIIGVGGKTVLPPAVLPSEVRPAGLKLPVLFQP